MLTDPFDMGEILIEELTNAGGLVSFFLFLPKRKIHQIFATDGIGDPEIYAGIFIFTVAHISGQYGKGVLRISSPLFDFQQGIYGKAMAQAMWRGLKKVHIADHPFGLIKADVFQRFVEQESDLLVCQRFLICTDQEKGTVIMRQYGFSNREIVFYLGNDLFWNGDQPVFTKFGLFNVKGAIITTIVVTSAVSGVLIFSYRIEPKEKR